MRNTMDETDIKEFDDIGTFTIPPSGPLPLYDYKAMMDYCREHKNRPADLSDDVRDSFQIGFC